MGNCCAGEDRVTDDRATLSPKGSKMKIAVKESNIDQFGNELSTFFDLSQDQKDAIKKYKLLKLVPDSRTQVSQANGAEAKFEGQLVGTIKEGVGHLQTEDGDLVVCHFKNDQAQGKGAIYFKNGDYYEGAILGNQPHGMGIYNNKDGRHFEGMYANGIKEGYGTLVWLDGSKYEGLWSKVQQGQGKYTDSKGKITEGEFHQGKKLK